MTGHSTIAMCLLAGLVFAGCDGGEGSSPPVDPCQDVDCSGHGACSSDDDNQPRCECDAGYHALGLECIEDGSDPCEGVTCSGHGVCVPEPDGVRCECDAGYRADGLACVEEGDGLCEDPDGLRRNAVEDGTTWLAGITLPSSTPMAEILADQEGFEGEFVQVEGLVVSVCPMSGNSAMLQDLEGNMILLAGNHAFHVPSALTVGRYVVAEGIFFQFFCRRGPHVNFGEHGGVVGDVDCPF